MLDYYVRIIRLDPISIRTLKNYILKIWQKNMVFLNANVILKNYLYYE